MYGVLCFFSLIISAIALLYIKLEKKIVTLLEAMKTELHQEIELAKGNTRCDTKNMSEKNVPENVDYVSSFRDEMKEEDAREIYEKKEVMKTELEMTYYHLYVLEKKKNTDFPEEKKGACEILPLINLSIADKIDVGRILFYRNFNEKFPRKLLTGHVFINIHNKTYMENKNMYIQFTRYSIAYQTISIQIYNMTRDTYEEEPSFDILHCLSSFYDLPDASREKIRIENRNNILHAMEQP